MGNTRSSTQTEENEDVWYTNGARQNLNARPLLNITQEVSKDQEINLEREQRRRELAEDFEKFKKELVRKHEKRRQLIAEKRKEMAGVRQDLLKEKEANQTLRELLKQANEEDLVLSQPSEEVLLTINSLRNQNEDLKNEMEKLRLYLKENHIIHDKNKELRISIAEMQTELQSLNTQVIGFEKERIDYQEHANALKDIIRVSKEMLCIREHQIQELKRKVKTIEEILASKEMNILSNDLRQEYERQLKNIRNLRTLYEERQKMDKRERENLQTQADELQKRVGEEQKKNSELQERVDELERDCSEKYDKIKTLESNLGLSEAECKELQSEMAVINQLFSKILLGFNNDQDIDLDNLIKSLQENHDLLTNIVVNEESNEVSALPKVLLDLVKQVNEKKEAAKKNESCNNTNENTSLTNQEEDSQPSHQLNSPEEIVENLPKVWRVLIELLSHQHVHNKDLSEETQEEQCYKSVQTPTGTRSVVSVSKTYIRLKDLILEKKSLEKEMMRLKHLNIHLEGRLQDQEQRLVIVSSELSKTWHVVEKMQKQHQQLHTQEKILRYELAQKRKLLTDLKEELEYCRQKWIQARDKNSSAEEQWKQLRTEFASRKAIITDAYSNSVESGYSDDKSSSDDDEQEYKDINQRTTKNCIQMDNIKETDYIEENVESINIIVEVRETTQSLEPNDDMYSLGTQETDKLQNCDEQRQRLFGSKNEPIQGVYNLDLQTSFGDLPIITNDTQQCNSNTDFCISNESEASANLVMQPSTSKALQLTEEFVARREKRMKRLEEQCNQLYIQVAGTSMKSSRMSFKLDNLHEMYSQKSVISDNTAAVSSKVKENADETNKNIDLPNEENKN